MVEVAGGGLEEMKSEVLPSCDLWDCELLFRKSVGIGGHWMGVDVPSSWRFQADLLV